MPKRKSSKSNYLRRSTNRFLGFTRYRSPFEAVLNGVRTLEQWADILNEERELELERLGLNVAISRQKPKTKHLV
jgi:hypothetical protein